MSSAKSTVSDPRITNNRNDVIDTLNEEDQKNTKQRQTSCSKGTGLAVFLFHSKYIAPRPLTLLLLPVYF